MEELRSRQNLYTFEEEAKKIAEGIEGRPPVWGRPGFSLMTGICMAWIGPKVYAANLVSALLGTLSILAVFLLEPRTRVFAAWGIVALLIAVFPANVYVAQTNLGLPDGVPGTGNALANWLRLPFQALFVLWAWWYTRPDDAAPTP